MLFRSCYHADGNGNITCLINTNQSVVASYRYDPFGNTLSSSGSLAAANLYRFSSKQIDSFTGMYYYGYRFYDPVVQRWLNRDPLGDWMAVRESSPAETTLLPEADLSSGSNMYVFARNDPEDLIDYDGLMPGFPSKPRPPSQPRQPLPGWPIYNSGRGGRCGVSGYQPPPDTGCSRAGCRAACAATAALMGNRMRKDTERLSQGRLCCWRGYIRLRVF